MEVIVKQSTYNRSEKKRVVEQTVTYTYADDIRMLAQAQVMLANLYDSLLRNENPVVVDQITAQINEKQKEVDTLRAIVDGYEVSV